eukprot:2663148-Pyramimonas_sp.AAC.2
MAMLDSPSPLAAFPMVRKPGQAPQPSKANAGGMAGGGGSAPCAGPEGDNTLQQRTVQFPFDIDDHVTILVSVAPTPLTPPWLCLRRGVT